VWEAFGKALPPGYAMAPATGPVAHRREHFNWNVSCVTDDNGARFATVRSANHVGGIKRQGATRSPDRDEHGSADRARGTRSLLEMAELRVLDEDLNP